MGYPRIRRCTAAPGIPFIAALGLVLACARRPGPPDLKRAQAAPKITSAASRASEPSQPQKDRTAESLNEICSRRAPCHLRKRRELGPLGEVWLVDLGRHLETESASPSSEENLGDGLEITDASDTFLPAYPHPSACRAFEYWLVRPEGKPERLTSVCNDGHGAASVGEHTVSFEAPLMHIRKSGGSAWRWEETLSLQLREGRAAQSSSFSFFTLGPNREQTSFDHQTLRGITSWYSPLCAEDGSPPDEEFEIAGSPTKGVDYFSMPLPQSKLPASFAEAAWRTADLKDCSLQIDASGTSGYLVHGVPGAPEDQALKVVAGEDYLYLEVRDDQWFFDSRNWVKSDHLEIWLSESDQGYGSPCVNPDPSAIQFGITLSDGKVHAGFGRPEPALLQVERSEYLGSVRLKLALPKHKRTSVLLSDADGKAEQERLIASSELRFGDGLSLGSYQALSDKGLSCQLENGRLQLVSLGFPE